VGRRVGSDEHRLRLPSLPLGPTYVLERDAIGRTLRHGKLDTAVRSEAVSFYAHRMWPDTDVPPAAMP